MSKKKEQSVEEIKVEEDKEEDIATMGYSGQFSFAEVEQSEEHENLKPNESFESSNENEDEKETEKQADSDNKELTETKYIDDSSIYTSTPEQVNPDVKIKKEEIKEVHDPTQLKQDNENHKQSSIILRFQGKDTEISIPQQRLENLLYNDNNNGELIPLARSILQNKDIVRTKLIVESNNGFEKKVIVCLQINRRDLDHNYYNFHYSKLAPVENLKAAIESDFNIPVENIISIEVYNGLEITKLFNHLPLVASSDIIIITFYC